MPGLTRGDIGLNVESLDIYEGINDRAFDAGVTSYDLALTIVDGGNQAVHGSLSYNSGLFEGAVARDMVKHYERLIASVLADPDQRITDVQMLDEGERHQLLVEWNETGQQLQADRCLHQL